MLNTHRQQGYLLVLVAKERARNEFYTIRDNMIFLSRFILLITALLFSAASFASESTLEYISLTQHTVSYIALLVFVIAYILVILEEQLHLKNPSPFCYLPEWAEAYYPSSRQQVSP